MNRSRIHRSLSTCAWRPAAAPIARQFGALSLLLAFSSAIGGCSHAKHNENGADKRALQVVATVGDRSITAAEVRSRLAEQPAFSQARFQNSERRKEFVDGLVRDELLLQEARRRGFDKDPEVKAAFEKLLIHKLTRASADESDKKGVPEPDLRRYYEQHPSEFTTPTRVRISHVFLSAAEKGAQREHTATEATRLLDDIKSRESRGEKQVLELTASRRSDDGATKATGGDLGYRTREELAQLWGTTFVEAGFALQTAGEIGKMIATDKGLHLVKLLGRQEGFTTPFEAAKSRIETRLKVEVQARAVEALLADLKAKNNVRVDEKALSEVELTPPQAPTSAPLALPKQ